MWMINFEYPVQTVIKLHFLGKTRVGNQAFVDYHDSTGIDHKRMVAKTDGTYKKIDYDPPFVQGDWFCNQQS